MSGQGDLQNVVLKSVLYYTASKQTYCTVFVSVMLSFRQPLRRLLLQLKICIVANIREYIRFLTLALYNPLRSSQCPALCAFLGTQSLNRPGSIISKQTWSSSQDQLSMPHTELKESYLRGKLSLEYLKEFIFDFIVLKQCLFISYHRN